MKHKTIFISYNPNNDFEQTLAIRLHTIGGAHGFTILLPDRFNSNTKISSETDLRIRSADYFILFSTSQLTPIVQQEVSTAFTHLKDKSKVLIIYDKVKNLKHNENCTEVFIDANKDLPQEILNKIITELKNNSALKSQNKANDSTISTLGGILLVGLGLLALGSLVGSGKNK
jgi:hypothetical protein